MSKKIRRIAVMGGPGSGKSTVAAWLFAQLKMLGIEAGHVQEAVKQWAYLGLTPQGFDQVFLLGKQMHMEDVLLRNGVDVVVSESPLLLSACYAKMYEAKGRRQLEELALEFDKEYPALYINVLRPAKYVAAGRYQDEAAAKKIDHLVKKMLEDNNVKAHDIACDDYRKMMSTVIDALGGIDPAAAKVILDSLHA